MEIFTAADSIDTFEKSVQMGKVSEVQGCHGFINIPGRFDDVFGLFYPDIHLILVGGHTNMPFENSYELVFTDTNIMGKDIQG